jgi:hypothetical protein
VKYLKRLIGVVCLLVMGFIACCAVTGFGVLVAIILIVFPTWQIVLGTLLGSVAVFLYLVGKKS